MNTEQRPIGSGFGASSTVSDVIRGHDLSGKVAIVTGGHAGIGLVTVKTLAGAGATVVVPARDVAKARAALGDVPRVEVDAMDLMDPASIDGFAGRFLASGRPLPLLINNAGIMAHPLVRDGRGYESQFSTNHLGHFQLTVRLWPALLRANGARVVELSSRGHMRGQVDFDDWNFERREYDRWAAYGQSKSANVLFAVQLDALGREHGVRAFAVHPGGIITDLARFLSRADLIATGAITEDGTPVIDPERNMKTPEQGAATTIWCATSPRLDGRGGVYCENCDIADAVPADSKSPRGVRPWATDPALAARLWALSEELTGAAIG